MFISSPVFAVPARPRYQLIRLAAAVTADSSIAVFIMNAPLQEAQRRAMVMGVRARRGPREISDFNFIPLQTVKGFKQVRDSYLEEGGDPDTFDIKRKEHKRRSDAYQEDKVEIIQGMIDEDPTPWIFLCVA